MLALLGLKGLNFRNNELDVKAHSLCSLRKKYTNILHIKEIIGPY